MFRPRRQVFIIGLPKTGTTSLEEALGQAGIRLMQSPTNLCLLPMLRSGKFDVLNAPQMAGFDGTTEMIGALYFEELLREYPNAYFIYTTREKKSWLRSAEAYWTHFETDEDEYFFRPMGRGSLDSDQLRFAVNGLFGSLYFETQRFAAAYDAHKDQVLSCYRKARHFMQLPLEWPNAMKTERLSKFIGQSITHYPHANAQAARTHTISNSSAA